MVSDVEHLFMYSFTIYIFSWVKYLCMSSGHLRKGFLIDVGLVWKFQLLMLFLLITLVRVALLPVGNSESSISLHGLC